VVRVLKYVYKGRLNALRDRSGDPCIHWDIEAVVYVLKYKGCVNTHRDINRGPCFEGIKLTIDGHEFAKTRYGYPQTAAVNMGTYEEHRE
jgi:hypothetical protein